MKLFIVESPARCPLIRKYLPDGFQVLASVGHIRDLDKKDLCKVGPQEKALKYLFYKIENTTSTNKNIYFSPALRYDSNPIDYEHITQYTPTEENKKSVFVSKNSSEECDCSFSNGTLSSLITNPNYPDVREFKAVKLLDIKID